ncbi:protein JTB [Rhinophrynus dorsalis]
MRMSVITMRTLLRGVVGEVRSEEREQQEANFKIAEATLPQEQSNHDNPSTQCWLAEEFVISKECSSCNEFESKRISECRDTGFIEQVSCSISKKAEFKSCRSVVKEKQVFWQFVGIMMGSAVALSLFVVYRQRTLDMRALEKVRKQIESI